MHAFISFGADKLLEVVIVQVFRSAICLTVDVCFFLRTSQDRLGEEGLHSLKFAKSSGEDGGLLQQRKQRSRARLHLAVSSLKGQSTGDNVSIQNLPSACFGETVRSL